MCAPGGGRAREDESQRNLGLEFISVPGGCLLMAWARQGEFSPSGFRSFIGQMVSRVSCLGDCLGYSVGSRAEAKPVCGKVLRGRVL